MSEMVLDLLKGSSAQQPIGFNHLVSETGLLPKTLTMILDGLYAKRTINEAAVTKNGVTERVVWLSGVVAPAARQSIVINPKKLPPSGHLVLPSQTADKTQVDIPEFLRNQQNLQVEKAEAAKPTEMPAPTTKVYKALKFIEANPNCDTASIGEAVGIDLRNVGNCLSVYIKNGDVVVTKHGRSPGTYILTKPADEAYLGKGHYQKKSATSGEPNEINSTQTEQASALDQPANALLEWDASGDQNQVMQGEKKADVEADGHAIRRVHGEQKTNNENSNGEAVISEKPYQENVISSKEYRPAKSENFRVAYTNDGCLMLMGLNDYGLPVELDVEQTFILMKFISEKVMPIGVSM